MPFSQPAASLFDTIHCHPLRTPTMKDLKQYLIAGPLIAALHTR